MNPIPYSFICIIVGLVLFFVVSFPSEYESENNLVDEEVSMIRKVGFTYYLLLTFFVAKDVDKLF